MSNVSAQDVIGNIEQYKFDPSRIQRVQLSVVRAIYDGTIDIVNGTSPFVNLLEANAVTTAAFMQSDEAMTRRQYARAALTQDELYLHMSDKDYIDRFAIPSQAPWTLLISKRELEAALVPVPGAGQSKITIPRNTIFKVADRSFSLQYPIDIRRLQHGGLQIVWDVSQPSPLLQLPTNLIEFDLVTMNGGEVFVMFKVDAQQFFITTRYNDVNAASGFTTTISLTDSFYYARVFYQNNAGAWVEIATTHTQQVYDPSKPTAVLKVTDSDVSVTIPVVYITTGLVMNKIRVDVYETVGKLDMLLGNYKYDDFSAQWLAIDAADNTPYTAAISTIRTMLVMSDGVTTGGRGALSLDDLRERVIENSVGPQDLPITNVQLQAEVVDAGYEIVRNVDTITNRIFLATKPMPQPVDNTLITAAASGISTVLLSFQESLTAQGVTAHYADGKIESITIAPSALYRSVNGVTKLVSQQAYASLMTQPNVQKIAAVSDGSYSYSPFHYVLDAQQDNFTVRPYYMDTPQILTKSFVAENATSGFQVSVSSSYAIERTATGYRLTLTTQSNEAWRALDDQEVFCQLSFKAASQLLTSFMVGVQQPRAKPTDERVYVFDMPTNFDIDENHTLDQPAFQVAAAPIRTRSDLLQDVNVLFATTGGGGVGLEYGVIDNALGRFQLPSNAMGITWERMKVRFGYFLDTLWAQARSVVGSVPYKTYATDVPAVYQEDVFNIDPATGSAVSIVNGAVVYSYKHRKGDPILDAGGQPTFRYRKGEPVLDSAGNPTAADGYTSQMLRQVDITTVEGVYRFANDSVATNYKKLLTTSLVTWLTQDLEGISERLLDRTKIFFYPKATQGDIAIITKAGTETSMAAGQEFTLTLHVPASTYNNPDLMAKISQNSIRIIDQKIQTKTIAVSAIEYALRDSYGTDVIDVKLEGLGGAANYDTVTLVDNAARLAIRKRLVAQADGTLIVQDSVNFNFIRHSLD